MMIPKPIQPWNPDKASPFLVQKKKSKDPGEKGGMTADDFLKSSPIVGVKSLSLIYYCSLEVVGQGLNLADLPGLVQKRKKGRPVHVIRKDSLPGIASASHMAKCLHELNSQRPGHNACFSKKPTPLSRIKN